MANNLLKHNYKLTTVLDINKDKCSNYPCKVAETPRQVAEECDITVTGETYHIVGFKTTKMLQKFDNLSTIKPVFALIAAITYSLLIYLSLYWL